MTLTLGRKQLLRSLFDIVIHQPEYANYYFNADVIKNFPDKANLDDILKVLSKHKRDRYQSETYYADLKAEINKIKDKDVRDVFETSYLSLPLAHKNQHSK